MNAKRVEPFDIDVWVKDNSRKVVDTDGKPVQIIAIPISEQFWHLVPDGIDPSTCVTFHARREGSKSAPVLCGGPSKQFFFAD